MRQRYVVIFYILICSGLSLAQKRELHASVKSVSPEWKIFSNNQFQPFAPSGEDKPRAVYFLVEANKHKGEFLRCSSENEFSLFINHQLITIIPDGSVSLSLDSLSKKYSARLQCVVFQKNGVEDLVTTIGEKKVSSVNTEEIAIRRSSDFLNFSIIASLILLAYFVILLRIHTRLVINYFNFFRLLSIQEREENLMGGRLTSTVNMLFYLFCSLLSGLVLTIIFHLGSGENSFTSFTIDSVWDGFAQWIKWSSIIFALLILKLIVIYCLSLLFKMGELISFHFFNFLRLLFLLFGASALLFLVYFIFKGQNSGFYDFILYSIAFVASVWVILIYLKLLTKVPFSFFHLFSYLCTSEIIPLVIIIKVLLF